MIPISREHYEQAIAKLNELDDKIPDRRRDRIAMSRLLQIEVEYLEQVIWDYESQQHRLREVPPKTG
jgi:hypothetical protein